MPLYILVLFYNLNAFADRPQLNYQSLPFDQKINLVTVFEVTQAKPNTLVSYILNHETDIYLLETPANELKDRSVNPLFMNLAYAKKSMLKFISEMNSPSLAIRGVMFSKNYDCCTFSRNTILIKDTADTQTLIHEFLHSVLVQNNLKDDSEKREIQFRMTQKRLNTYRNMLNANPDFLAQPLWRKNILTAQNDFIDELYLHLRSNTSEEAIIEKYLKLYITEESPYFFKRQLSSKHFDYGEDRINNGVDLYNVIQAQIQWSVGSTNGLMSIVSKLAEQNEKVQLTEKDRADFELESKKQDEKLKLIEKELLDLKAFYLK